MAVAVTAIMVGMVCRIPVQAVSVGFDTAALSCELVSTAMLGEASCSPSPEASAEAQDWTRIAKAVTNLGGAGTAIALSGAFLVIDPPTGEALLNATAGTAAVVGVLKVVCGRARPYLHAEQGRYTGLTLSDDYHSMPSGHTANAFSMAAVLSERFPWLAPAFYGLAAAVGWSRVQLQMHWPSDVVAGAAIGSFIGNQAAIGNLDIFGFGN